ncbi:hypothetical protein [Ammoniphilus oxalaticus]|uniref:hypothetical protein n=1 Tax=Ammoniphilus oxalaticus TaxID=66863 RepID=UPI0014758BF9|nr:hypothetical protein [Ammoniphilus oxalaticus]
MSKYNYLDEVPLADLTSEQLSIVQQAEASLSNKDVDDPVYLIAFRKAHDE